jgi:hypothetical protein
MPYRRLPNTDSARLKALNNALNKGKEIPPFKLAFKQNTLTRIQALLPNYENAISEHKNAYNLQIEKTREYNKAMKKAKMYISHFIQVINMSVHRGEITSNVRDFFELEGYEKKLPALNSEKNIFNWAEKLMNGEQKRRMKGMSPITNPTIAVVKVHIDQFNDACHFHGGLKKRVENAQVRLANIRNEADIIIQQLWNDIEDTFKDLPEDLKRAKCSEYGVIYVFRKNELNGFNLLNVSQIEMG